MLTLDLRPNLEITDQIFEQICQNNPDLRLERTAQGELIAMAPSGSETGRQNLGLSAQLVPNKFVSSCISKSFLLKGFTKKHTSSIVFCTFR